MDPALEASARVYSDEEFAALIATLHVSAPSTLPPPPSYHGVSSPSVMPPHTPPRTPRAPTTSRPRGVNTTLYQFSSPTKSGYTDSWATAGAATQGVAGAHVRSVKKRRKKKHQDFAVYAVFFGRNPGVYYEWAEAHQCNNGALGAIYKGYGTDEGAEGAYEYARARGWTRVCTSRPASPTQPAIAALPLPSIDEAERPNPLHGNDTLDQTWYVVYRGVTPGVYHSILEAQLNTIGVRNQLYEAVTGREEAYKRYRLAQEQRETDSAAPPSYI
ncbi:hypothetical protein DFH06DRAFT_1124059 [Mycena polygramma]|nr:hypothetical protein DFH06DRAFT_1124059 [Mycena polygramma]